MIEQLFKDIYDEKLAKGAIVNDRMEGFKEDYLVLHILIKRFRPTTFMEIGTHTGMGTMIIKNALGKYSILFSLDLPDDKAFKSKQHPLSEGKKGVGFECTLPYHQLREDSSLFNYEFPKCEGYFVDGEHTFENVFHETSCIVKNKPKIIVYHDADIPEVYNGIVEGMKGQPYSLYRVTDTRILYALKKQQ